MYQELSRQEHILRRDFCRDRLAGAERPVLHPDNKIFNTVNPVQVNQPRLFYPKLKVPKHYLKTFSAEISIFNSLDSPQTVLTTKTGCNVSTLQTDW